jgi:CubicO group peptidase (beta-lactamase class C family)
MLCALLATIPIGALGKTRGELIAAARERVRENFAPKTPGLSVAVGVGEELIWAEGFGFADLETKRPVTTSTLFRIGSISKPLTAAGLMLLVERHKLDLDSDIHRYVPDFPDKGAVITTRQLAGHLAGIRHYNGTEFLLNKSFPTIREGLRIFENDPLLSKPGEKYHYSTYGWSLISLVIQNAGKQDFLLFMAQNVFQPLGMKHTIADYAERDLPQRTCFYDVAAEGGFKRSPAVDNSYKWAGGGFLSTPEDLVRFGAAHLGTKFLKPESLEALFRRQKISDGTETDYGIGWFIHKDKLGHRVLAHTGGSIGGTSVLLLHPDSRVVVAMTSNCTKSPFDSKDIDIITESFSELLAIK